MLKNDIKVIIQQFFKRLNISMTLIKKDFDSAAIHDFRVDVKKLRSFIKLLALEPKAAKDLMLPPGIKKLYTLCGKIRDIQLQQLRMKEAFKDYNQLDEYENLLNNEMNRWMKKVNIALRYRPLLDAEQKLPGNLPDRLSRGSIQQFFKQKKENMCTIISVGFFIDDELHSIRKNIKDIIYINKLLVGNVGMPVKAMQWDKAEIKRAELLAQELGRYNDYCFALSFLKSDRLKTIKSKERKSIQIIRKEWKLEKRLKRKEIIASLPAYSFLFPVLANLPAAVAKRVKI